LNNQGIEEYISGDILSESDDEMANHSKRSMSSYLEEENQSLLTPYERLAKIRKEKVKKTKSERHMEKKQ